MAVATKEKRGAGKPRYAWRENSRQKGSAQVVGREIHRLMKEHGGNVEAEHVVEAAKDPSNPLHNHFDWDNTKAARQWRLQQARVLIASITIIELPKQVLPVRAFTKAIVAGKGMSSVGRVGGYNSTVNLMSKKDTRKAVLTRAYGELLSWQQRYEAYKEFSKVVSAIKNLPRL